MLSFSDFPPFIDLSWSIPPKVASQWLSNLLRTEKPRDSARSRERRLNFWSTCNLKGVRECERTGGSERVRRIQCCPCTRLRQFPAFCAYRRPKKWDKCLLSAPWFTSLYLVSTWPGKARERAKWRVFAQLLWNNLQHVYNVHPEFK